MGQRIREYDWSNTSLGPVHTWPQSLRTCIRIMLSSSQPIWIGWGRQLIKFYNDPYKAIVGGKHPWALGSPASVVWKDIWLDIEDMLRRVMEDDEGTYVEAQLLIMERNGYPEETYYTFSYTPIPGDDGGTAGMICFNTDDTYRIISERQLKTITQLGKALTDSKNEEAVVAKTIQSLQENKHDFPFVLFYIVSGNKATLTKTTNLNGHSVTIPQEVGINGNTILGQCMQQANQTGKMQVLDDVQNVFGQVPKGAWPVPPRKAIVLPIAQAGHKDANGFLVFGFNPYRLLDENYSNFFSLISDQVSTSFSNVHVLEEERKRAEALAEIDRAKTTFFSNISHEFRTPLTLLLGPIEDVLQDPGTQPMNRERMVLARRNALRMQKLVNTLLEFSRIEAGRVEGRYSRVNIVALTQDLASTFRSAIEKAGMQLLFSYVQFDADVYVDVDMWEKIVLNLVSNAFKYSKQGKISLHINYADDSVSLSVTDTGIGIPGDQLDKIFNRFHRIDNTEGRSQEGTGIGLAMIKELVKLHGGTISVTSVQGAGSTFIVTIPAGKGHLPADKIVDGEYDVVLTGSQAFLQEALKWLPGEELPVPSAGSFSGNDTSVQQKGNQPTILLADDNADMREYVRRLLEKQFIVITATDGEEAYAKMLKYKPDLLISDIMMPKLDGFGLLKKVRSHPDMKSTPVIFLSARAGGEATVEGLDAGADDYMVKPFSAKELMVRVTNLIRINQVRRETEQQFYQLFLQAPAYINVFKGPEHCYEFFHPKNKELFGNVDFTGLKIRDAVPTLEGEGILEMMDEVYRNNITIQYNERYVELPDENGKMVGRYFNAHYQPWYDIKGKVQGVLNFATDVTETVQARNRLQESEKRFRNLVMQAPVSITVLMGRELMVEIANDNYLELVGKQRENFVGKPLWEGLPEVKTQVYADILQGVLDTGTPYTGYEAEVLLVRNGVNETLYVNFIYSPIKDVDGKTTGIMVVAIDVTPQVTARRKIEESERSLIEMANAIPQLAWVADAEGIITYCNSRIQEFKNTGDDIVSTQLWYEIIQLEDKNDVALSWKQALANGGAYQHEHRIQMKDKSYRWHLSRAIPQKDDEGNIVKWFGTATDINDAKEQANILEQEVKKRTQELRQLNISLQQSNEDLQQFAHVASHDLKEPVRKIKTFSGRLQDEYGNLLPEKGKVFLDKVQQATSRMFSMIEGVLNYSTLNSAEQTIENINLNEVFENIETDLEIAIQQKNAVINKTVLPFIEGAPVLIYQLFYNLVNNSLKFAKQNVQPVINISSLIENDGAGSYVKVIISDNGIGFEHDYEKTIFDTFTRLNAKDKYEGTGLGLALCKKIAERHHGSITATGVKNKGAAFIVTLPLMQNDKNI